MSRVRVNTVIKFLKAMQMEKVSSLGSKEAKEDNEQIQKVIDDIEMFYEMELIGV